MKILRKYNATDSEQKWFLGLIQPIYTGTISRVFLIYFLNYVDMDSEVEVLGYGISLILLNVGMYLGIPAIVIIGIRKKF